MNETNFKDYYKTLQVHYDASTEVIRAAYQKLSENFSKEPSALSELSEAFEILSDEKRRAVYHREWLSNFIERAQFIQTAPKHYIASPDDQKASAENVLQDFFQAVFLQDWENAYLRLSQKDRDCVSLNDFISWRTAISKCYNMQEFNIRYVRTLDSVTLDSITYRQVVEFQVIVTDLNQKNQEITTDTLRKYVTYDADAWRVCLGMRDIRKDIYKYRQLAEKLQRDATGFSLEYLSTAERTDTMTGLLSEAGFFEEASREVERNRRYHNPFTLLSFQVLCEEKSRENNCVCHLADIIRSTCRATDIAARLDNNQIICLLTETKMDDAEAAAQKFLRVIRENPNESYRVSFGLVFYNGYSSLSDAVLACCHMAGLPSHY